jgi:chitodextrinase
MKKLFAIAIIFGVYTVAHAATPTITNVTGTIATGQTLTITGMNMVNETATNSNWDTAFQSNSKMYGFESAVSSGTALKTSPANDNWYLRNNSPPGTQPSGAISNDCRFVASPKLAGSLSMHCRAYGGKSMQTNDGGSGFSAYPGSTSGNFYFRYYTRYRTNNGNYPDVYTKMTVTQPSGSGSMWYLDWAGASAGQTPSALTTKYGAISGPSPSLKLENDRWYCFEGAWLSPGTYQLWVDGKLIVNTSPGVSMPDNAYPQWGIINFRSNNVYADFSQWLDNLAFGHTSRIYPSSTIEISGDNGTTWKWQPPTSLSDTSIAVQSELPTLTATNYLLRVTNNLQQTSSTYKLTGAITQPSGGDSQAPTTPASLTATAMSSSQINLSWPASTDNTGVTGYKVYRGGTHIATPTGTSYSNTGLSASTSYSYKVSAIDAAGNESSQSVTAIATTQSTTVTDTTAPSTPAGLSASATSSSQINLSWTASTDNVGVTGYRIYRGGTYLATSTGTSYSNTGLTASTSYSYRVSAVDAAGNESSQSTAASATTQAGTASGTVLFQESFENSSFSGRGWYDNTNHGTIVSGGQSGNSLQWAWAQGATAPTNGASLRKKITPTESLYLSFYVKFQTGWRGSQKAYHPHMILIPSSLDSDYTPLANNYLNTYVSFISDIGSPYTIRPQISIQDQLRVNTANGTPPNNLTAVTENRSVAYCNTPVPSGATGMCYADNPYYSANTWKASTASVSTNVWHHVEVYFKMNSISGGKGQSNGIMQKWVNGNLVINRSDVLYRTNQDATKKWAQFVFAPWIGDGSPIAQTMWLDELTVATAPPSAGGDTQAPAVPASLSASAVSSSQINLSWPASTDNVAVTGYKIYRGGTYLATSTGTSYSNTGLAASTSYSYKVSAIDAAGNESSQSITATATTQAPPDTTAPSIPSGLSANATSTSQVNLSWTASTDNVAVTGYKIYRGGTNIGTSTGTTYSDTGLTAATSYSYKVSAIDAAGNESSQSATASATTQTPPDTTAPSTPSGLSANATSSSQINLSWTASTDNVGVTGYKIYRGGTNIGTSTGTSYSNTGLTANTSYSYKVSAIDAAGNESSQSTTATATTQAATGGTDTTAPSTPSGLTANAASSSEITLSWTASTDDVGVTGYKIYRGGTYVAASTGTSYTNPALTASTSYSYSVSAIDAAGNESSKSTTATATTLAEETGDEALFQETFENSNFSARGWYDNTTHGTIVSGGQSGNCLQWAWAQGATLPANGASMRMKFTPTDSLYVSFYVKFQSGWRGSQKTYHPHMILIPSDLDSDYTPLANNYLNTYIEYISDVGSPYVIRPVLAIQDQKRVNTTSGTPPNNLTAVTENRSVAYCNTPVPSGATGVCYADNPYYSANTWKESTASVPANAWQHVEVYFKMNSISGGKGQSDGIMQQWINGSLVIDRSDVLYRTNQDATKKWAQFVFAPWIGDGSPIAQTMWLDELTVSTSPPFSSTLSPPAGFSVQEQ